MKTKQILKSLQCCLYLKILFESENAAKILPLSNPVCIKKRKCILLKYTYIYPYAIGKIVRICVQYTLIILPIRMYLHIWWQMWTWRHVKEPNSKRQEKEKGPRTLVNILSPTLIVNFEIRFGHWSPILPNIHN